MEPEVLPYQDILESKPKVATIKPESTQNSQENKNKTSYESPIYEVDRKIKSFEKPSVIIDQETKNNQNQARNKKWATSGQQEIHRQVKSKDQSKHSQQSIKVHTTSMAT